MSRKASKDKELDPPDGHRDHCAKPKWLTVQEISKVLSGAGSSPWVRLGVRNSKAYILDGSARIATAMMRYASSKTRPFSRSRVANRRPVVGLVVTGCAAARLSACCSRRSMLNSSARIGSSASAAKAEDGAFRARRNTRFTLASQFRKRKGGAQDGSLVVSSHS